MLQEQFNQGLRAEMMKYNIVFPRSTDEARKLVDYNTSFSFDYAVTDIHDTLSLWKGNEFTGSWDILKGADVLDLGAGSYYTTYGGDVEGFYCPEFSRLCAVNGANVIAIDQNRQTNYDALLFTPVKANLVEVIGKGQLAALPELTGKTFDIIHSNAFLGDDPDPNLLRLIGEEGILLLEKLLIEQGKDLLKEGGVMDIGQRSPQLARIIYRKTNGNLSEEKMEY